MSQPTELLYVAHLKILFFFLIQQWKILHSMNSTNMAHVCFLIKMQEHTNKLEKALTFRDGSAACLIKLGKKQEEMLNKFDSLSYIAHYNDHSGIFLFGFWI